MRSTSKLLGFPLWLPILLGIMLFLVGQLLAADHRPVHNKPVRSNYYQFA